MKSEGTLLVELSAIQGKRLGREVKLMKDLMDEGNRTVLSPKLEEIVWDNWSTDEEIGKRYFNKMTEKEKAVFI